MPWSILENSKSLSFIHLVNHLWPMTWTEHNGACTLWLLSHWHTLMTPLGSPYTSQTSYKRCSVTLSYASLTNFMQGIKSAERLRSPIFLINSSLKYMLSSVETPCSTTNDTVAGKMHLPHNMMKIFENYFIMKY